MKKYAEKIDELIEIADCSEDAEEKAWIDKKDAIAKVEKRN